MQMDALITVRAVYAECDQSGPHIMARDFRSGSIGAVIAEDILLIADLILLAQFDQLLRQMIIERSALIGHADGNAEFGGILSRRGRAIIDGYDRDDIGMDHG